MILVGHKIVSVGSRRSPGATGEASGLPGETGKPSLKRGGLRVET